MMTVWLGLLVWLLGAGDDFAAGTRAYREGRFRDALAAFAAAERLAGERASPELLYDMALAALAAGELAEAEAAAEKAAARGGGDFLARRDFILGSAAFVRCKKAGADANRPEAEPFAFNPAITQAEAARSAWQRAASSRPDWPDWPAARRNVERALLEIEQLKRQQAAAEENRRKQKGASPPKDPQRPQAQPQKPPENAPPSSEAPADEPQPNDREEGRRLKPADRPEPPPEEASPEPVARLLEKLSSKEREKLALRRTQRKAHNDAVEKDW